MIPAARKWRVKNRGKNLEHYLPLKRKQKTVLKTDTFSGVRDTSRDKISADKSDKKKVRKVGGSDNVYPEAGWSCEARRSVFEFRYPGRDRFRRSIKSDHVLTSGSATTLKPFSKKWKKVAKKWPSSPKSWRRREKWCWNKKRTNVDLFKIKFLIWRIERLKLPSFEEVRKKIKTDLRKLIKEHFKPLYFILKFIFIYCFYFIY